MGELEFAGAFLNNRYSDNRFNQHGVYDDSGDAPWSDDLTGGTARFVDNRPAYDLSRYAGQQPTYGAPRKKGGGKWGCLTVLIVIAVTAVMVVWYLGYIDRWLFEASLEKAGNDTASIAESHSGESAAAPSENSQKQEYYAYASLGEDDKKKYRLVLAALETREEQPYPTDDMDDLERIFQCVQADHPELFYVEGMSMETIKNKGSGLVERVAVSGRFAYSEEEVQAISERIDAAAESCLAGLPEGADDYGKAKYLYEWLASNIVYDRATAAASGSVPSDSAEHNTSQSIEGALLNGSAVCSGYAGAFQLLMQRLGFTCCYVMGTGNGELHAWCLVMLDGEYYYVDPTWADPQSEGENQELGYVNYDYLNIMTADLNKSHVISCPFELPECTAVADNYYVREGLLFDSEDELRLGTLAGEAAVAGVPLQVRFSNEDAYRWIKDNFVGNGRIGSYLPAPVFRYSCSDVNCSIVIIS